MKARRLIPCIVLLTALCTAQTTTWTQIKPNTPPPGREGHSMTYDTARQRADDPINLGWRVVRTRHEERLALFTKLK